MTLDEFLKEKARKKDQESFRYLLDDARGRWFLAHLMASNHIFTTTFTGNSDTFRREGARSVVLTINDEIRQMGEDGIISLLQAEGEYLKWVAAEKKLFEAESRKGAKKYGQR